MRLLVLLSFIVFAGVLVPLGQFIAASDAECPAGGAEPSNASGSTVQQAEGERRVPRLGTGDTMTVPSIMKVDGRKGSPDVIVEYEEIAPGSVVPAHAHPESEEALFVQQGEGLATIGSQERTVTAGAAIYIPAKTRVTLKNTGTQTLSVLFISPRRR